MSHPVLTKSLKSQFEATDDRPIELVEVPEWGLTLRVRGLSAGDKQRYEESLVSWDAQGKMTVSSEDGHARLLVLTIVDEQGQLIFTSGDVAMLSRKSGAAVDRVVTVAQRLSGLGRGSEALKNDSGPAPPGA